MQAFPNAKVVCCKDAGRFVAEEKSDKLIAEVKDLSMFFNFPGNC